MAQITTDQVWNEIENQLFAVMGMVTNSGESRTAGVVYTARDRKLYIASLREAWKVRHLERNPHVSLTVTIAKRIPVMPWIKIPPATITFCGTARILEPTDVDAGVIKDLFRGLETTAETSSPYVVIEVTPEGDFVTYGVGVSLMGMRDTVNARGRAQV